MNTPEILKEKISMLVPNASLLLDPSETPEGSTWLDIESGNQTLTIEYKPSLGFGLYSSTDDSYGSGPEEVYRSMDSLLKRISMFLIEHKINIKLREVRELLGKTQEEISILSGQKQPSISKLENRTDMQLSTSSGLSPRAWSSVETRIQMPTCLLAGLSIVTK